VACAETKATRSLRRPPSLPFLLPLVLFRLAPYRWDDATGSNLYEHLAGVNDLLLALATFQAAVKRWPGAKITLCNGARIIEKTWPADD
jgi:hypothetical protein